MSQTDEYFMSIHLLHYSHTFSFTMQNKRTIRKLPNVQYFPFQPTLQIHVPLVQCPFIKQRVSHRFVEQSEPVQPEKHRHTG